MIFFTHLSSYQKKLLAFNSLFLLLLGIVLWSTVPREREGIVMPILPPLYQGESATTTPVRVSIPSIDVDASIVSVGITSGGNMAVPVKYEDVGWYRYGPVPGGIGNSVIAGHLDTGTGKPAVFYRLSQLTVGDRVYIEDAEGNKSAFAVREIRLVDYENPPLEEIFGKSADGMHLNIITCDGTWIPELKMYDKRLVVFTDRVELDENNNL